MPTGPGARRPLINVIGWYDRRNLGDEAFKTSFNSLFGADATVAFTTSDIIPHADKIVLGGGDVIKDYYLSKIPKDREFSIIGAGLGYESEIELLEGRKIDKLWLRNKKDVELARRVGLTKAEYMPDLLFAGPVYQHQEKPPTEGRKKKMAVILTDAVNFGVEFKSEQFYAEYMKYELALALDYLSEWYEISFIPFSDYHYAYDSRMHMDVATRMNKASHTEMWSYTGNTDLMINQLRDFDLVVTSKLHGMLFAVAAGTPFVNLGITRKSQVFAEEYGLDYKYSIPPYSFTYDRFMAMVKAAESTLAQGELTKVRDLLVTQMESKRLLIVS